MLKIKALENAIEETYNKIPYHNWSHGKYVGEINHILGGEGETMNEDGIAGLLHDSGHTGIANAPHDEELACEIADRILTEHGCEKAFREGVKYRIMGTVFGERGNLVSQEQKQIADADISIVGGDYYKSISTAAGLLLETHGKKDILSNERIIEFFAKDQQGFFSFLTGITGDENNPFLTEIARTNFPHFSKNKDMLAEDIEQHPEKLIQIVRTMEKESHIIKFRKS